MKQPETSPSQQQQQQQQHRLMEYNDSGQRAPGPQYPQQEGDEERNSGMTESQQWAARQRATQDMHQGNAQNDGATNAFGASKKQLLMKQRKKLEKAETPSPMGMKRSSAAMARRAAREATAGS